MALSIISLRATLSLNNAESPAITIKPIADIAAALEKIIEMKRETSPERRFFQW